MKGLGRGLSSLIGENMITKDNLNENDARINHIFINKIYPNPEQPRVIFDLESLEELKNSIAQNGILQPILVKLVDGDKYQIIAGERRWRAAKELGLADIPAIIKDFSTKEVLEIALIENIQRENLTPLEEAEAYKKLIDEYGYTQEKMATTVSKSRSHVANLLRALTLPDEIKQYLNEGKITLGHAKLLINQNNALELAHNIVKNNLNVRDTESLLKANKNPKNKDHKEEDMIALEKYLNHSLDLQVKIDPHLKEGNKISIYCPTMSDLDIIVQRLTRLD